MKTPSNHKAFVKSSRFGKTFRKMELKRRPMSPNDAAWKIVPRVDPFPSLKDPVK